MDDRRLPQIDVLAPVARRNGLGVGRFRQRVMDLQAFTAHKSLKRRNPPLMLLTQNRVAACKRFSAEIACCLFNLP